MKRDVNPKEVLIVCPFFKYSDMHHIACEGVCPGNTVSLNFENPHDKNVYKDEYCRDIHGYHYCRVCEMLEAKYADDGR